MSTSHGLDRVTGSMVPIDDEEVPTIHNDDETIGIVNRKHIDAYVAAWTLVKPPTLVPFPMDHATIREWSNWGNNQGFIHAAERAGIGLTGDRLGAAVQYVNPNPPMWEPHEFTVWAPTTDPNPYVLESDLVPYEFLIECQWDGREGFREQFGATSCISCELLFDDPVIRCEECGQYPKAVRNNLAGLSEKHPGVLAIIAPTDL